MGVSDTSNTSASSDSNDDVELGDTPQQFDETRTDIVQRKKKETSGLLYNPLREVVKKRKENKEKQTSNGLSRFELFALFVCIILLIFIVFSLMLYIGKAYKPATGPKHHTKTTEGSDSTEYKRIVAHEERIARAIGALLKEDEEIEDNNTLEKERNEHLLHKVSTLSPSERQSRERFSALMRKNIVENAENALDNEIEQRRALSRMLAMEKEKKRDLIEERKVRKENEIDKKKRLEKEQQVLSQLMKDDDDDDDTTEPEIVKKK